MLRVRLPGDGARGAVGAPPQAAAAARAAPRGAPARLPVLLRPRLPALPRGQRRPGGGGRRNARVLTCAGARRDPRGQGRAVQAHAAQVPAHRAGGAALARNERPARRRPDGAPRRYVPAPHRAPRVLAPGPLRAHAGRGQRPRGAPRRGQPAERGRADAAVDRVRDDGPRGHGAAALQGRRRPELRPTSWGTRPC